MLTNIELLRAVAAANAAAMLPRPPSIALKTAELSTKTDQSNGLHSTIHSLSDSIVPILIKTIAPYQIQIELPVLACAYEVIMERAGKQYTWNDEPCHYMIKMDAFIQVIMSVGPLTKYNIFLIRRIMREAMLEDRIVMQTTWMEKILDLVPVYALKQMSADWEPRDVMRSDSLGLFGYSHGKRAACRSVDG